MVIYFYAYGGNLFASLMASFAGLMTVPIRSLRNEDASLASHEGQQRGMA